MNKKNECWMCLDTIEENQLYVELTVCVNDELLMVQHVMCGRCASRLRIKDSESEEMYPVIPLPVVVENLFHL